MHIVVCVKRILDPEMPRSFLRIDEAAKQVVAQAGSPFVISPFDEQAVEAALRIRENAADPAQVSITVLTMGEPAAEKIVRYALALGADAGAIVIDQALSAADGYATSRVLASAIRKLGNVDLILAGRQSADLDAGVVGLGIAEVLDVPVITLAKSIAIDDGHARVERAVGEGEETVTAPLLAVVTIAHEFGAVRKPSLRETMRAGKKRVDKWNLADIGLELWTVAPRCIVERLFQPESTVAVEWIAGESPSAIAKNLVRRMTEERLL